MDRRNALRSHWRADLPRSLRFAEIVSRLNYRYRVRPTVGAVIGVVSFLGGGIIVVATASLLALSV